MGGLPFLEYLREYQSDLAFETYRHAALSLQVVLVAALIGVAISLLTYRSAWASSTAISVTVIAFTIPSLALFGLMQPITGLGLATVFPVLVLYALLPVIRNTIVGLREVDPTLVDAATGLGMSRRSILLRVELPLAWPVILTGMRVSTLLALGVAAIGAYIQGPGLGNEIFDGLSRISSPNALNLVLGGTLGVVLLAVLSDLFYVLLNRLTTSRGIR